MTSIRKSSGRKNEDDILDAARACVEAFGVRRTTLTDVARRAGVSRPTVYRHWPDISSLVGDLMTRELKALFAEAVAEATEADALGRIVHGATGTVRAVWHHSLFSRFLDSEAELLATYVFHRLGSSQHAALELLHAQIAEGQRDGSVRAGEPGELSRVVLLTVQSIGASRRLVEDTLTEDALLDSLGRLLTGYLRDWSAAA
ncbi:TetR/AcrR family transcriptional regulator [Streptomyces tubbatahanensis]|uniref:TetR/AcrR family transcriptional regulator n=1 Tax=Streptomyces tubbatahanensis TaxID=2923272 RepID=A0ABY3XLJ6_9ACTN|nr:TetR/AcrR family transcriptional regulator [Streptomyces tubbatahanensis]UNS95260.1 TetR/AcrR family transcriptional regulator [Streptomyces tubbatahanensis]